jgi:ArsR family metal-binding transcriptional regulator
LLLEIEKVKEKITQLDESEAKSLLMIIYARLDTAINGTGGDEFIKKTLIDLFDIYKRLPDKIEQKII